MTITLSEALEKQFIWPEQKEIAQEICRDIKAGKVDRAMLLFSEFQAGKTNAIFAISVLALHEKLVRNIFVSCGDASLNLYEQTKERLANTHDSRIRVLRRSQFAHYFQKYKADPKSLFIIDESHFADNRGGQLDREEQIYKFLSVPTKNGPYLLFVSATPFSEDPGRFREYILKPGRGYIGVKHLLQAQRIIQLSAPALEAKTGHLNPDFPLWKTLDESQIPPGKGKWYYLLRIPTMTSKTEAQFKKEMEVRYPDVRVLTWDMHNDFDGMGEGYLSTLADSDQNRVEVILVKHKARMGITLDTSRCLGMYEYVGLNPNVSTLLQSWVGRAPGYGKRKETFPIYTNKKVAEIYAQYSFSPKAMMKAYINAGFQTFTNNCKSSAPKRRVGYFPLLVGVERAKYKAMESARGDKIIDQLIQPKLDLLKIPSLQYTSLLRAGMGIVKQRLKKGDIGFSYGHGGREKLLRMYCLDIETIKLIKSAKTQEAEYLQKQLVNIESQNVQFFVAPFPMDRYEELPKYYKELFRPKDRLPLNSKSYQHTPQTDEIDT